MDIFDFIARIGGTIALRPYFAGFLLAYFLACSLHLGVKRAFLFAVAGYIVAWASEYSSIHNGFPYGLYYYIHTTRDVELWILGVPFMDSMSFVFLSYASYSMALLVTSPWVRCRGGIYPLESRKIRHSLKVRILGALFCVGLDVIIDPRRFKGRQVVSWPDLWVRRKGNLLRCASFQFLRLVHCRILPYLRASTDRSRPVRYQGERRLRRRVFPEVSCRTRPLRDYHDLQSLRHSYDRGICLIRVGFSLRGSAPGAWDSTLEIKAFEAFFSCSLESSPRRFPRRGDAGNGRTG